VLATDSKLQKYADLVINSVMWSETIGLRTRPVWDQNNRS